MEKPFRVVSRRKLFRMLRLAGLFGLLELFTVFERLYELQVELLVLFKPLELSELFER